MKHDLIDTILGQPKVRQFLRSCALSGQIGQSYLFCGPAGSNKMRAAWALAQIALCDGAHEGHCEQCEKIRRRKHPDVHLITPEGAQGYLVGQIRSLLSEVSHAPIQAKRVVYIIDRVDLMNASSANAFLKTLEEPPEHVVFILLGRTRESVLPTIVSRCQVVAFRHIPAREASGIVSQNSGVSDTQARIALAACDGSLSRAIEFARSNERMLARQRVIEVLEALAAADDMDVLHAAKELVALSSAPLDEARIRMEEEAAQSAEFLSKSALRDLEAQHKRALSARTTELLHEVTSVISSWLRDVLAVTYQRSEDVVHADRLLGIQRAATHADAARVVRALRAVDECRRAIRYNVSPETCIDVLLFEIREELYGSHSACGVAI